MGKIAQEIAALAKVEFLVETNSGTYGAAEACRKVGTGDPRFADRCVYETVGGERRSTGPDAEVAPGRMRHIDRSGLSAARERLQALRAERRGR